ncbi:pleckstrin homology and RUN domain containing M1 isoform X2 [Lycorma delicatula]|uniref:pleckstrin homology and RUN domain containing M1 isoform X2 n=1 Tax=Lycorma delicatula TaxID=130591 RepID=UPI003F511A63
MDSFFRQSDDNIVKDALLSQLVIAVKEVQADVRPAESNSDTSASFLSTVLEAIFIHGLKETLMNRMSQVIVTDLEQRPDPNFWAPLLIFSHRDVIRQISSLSQVTTDVGRGRAWLRLALNECLLSSYLYSMTVDNAALKPYYNNNAFLRDSEKLDLAKQLIEGIETCSFCFACNSSLLNIWTNMPLLMAGISTAPLRSCPITSGTDVAQTLTSEEDVSSELNDGATHSISIYGYTNRIKNPKLIVDEEEALKIILGTPVNESPLQIKMNAENSCEEVEDLARDVSELEVEEIFQLQINAPSVVAESTDNSELVQPIDAVKAVSSLEEHHGKTSGIKSSPVSTDVSLPQQSYDSLLRSYNNVTGSTLKTTNLKDVMQQYDQSLTTDESNTISRTNAYSTELDNPEMISSTFSGCDFEVVPVSTSLRSNIPEYNNLIQYLTNLAREQGLDAQNYSCAYCKNPIGINMENVRVCGFTGEYYCKECYGCPLEEWIIPARVLHNWDFKRQSISERAEKFLAEIQDHPLLDMKAINPRIYVVVDEMAQLQTLRMQLNLLRAYLFTCRQPVGEDLKKQIWPKEYLYEHVHLYSVSCRVCNAVFHSECLNRTKPCPKCERQRRRRMQDLTDS